MGSKGRAGKNRTQFWGKMVTRTNFYWEMVSGFEPMINSLLKHDQSCASDREFHESLWQLITTHENPIPSGDQLNERFRLRECSPTSFQTNPKGFRLRDARKTFLNDLQKRMRGREKLFLKNVPEVKVGITVGKGRLCLLLSSPLLKPFLPSWRFITDDFCMFLCHSENRTDHLNSPFHSKNFPDIQIPIFE